MLLRGPSRDWEKGEQFTMTAYLVRRVMWAVLILLLLSIFFTGFFLPISGFMWPAGIISNLLPMTHGMEGFQSLLLKGEGVSSGVWWSLLVISALAYGLVALTMRHQYRRIGQ